MEFKRCSRCGAFFSYGDNEVCYDCVSKDKIDIAKINSVLENSAITSAQELSINSGVKLDNINRYIENNFIEF